MFVNDFTGKTELLWTLLAFSVCIWSTETEAANDCQKPLVSGAKLTASSRYGDGFAASKAILGQTSGSWAVRKRDKNQWLQVDLQEDNFKVTRVATQGRSQNAQWVKKYKLQYSDDGENFQYYKEQGQTTDKVIYMYIWR